MKLPQRVSGNRDCHIALDTAIRRAQIYDFLAGAYLYPGENWVEDVPDAVRILGDLGFAVSEPDIRPWELAELQAAYRRDVGLAGSLCYETEYGLPHEFRQSQELADIAGFYRAFGFEVGGTVRERPDHLAVELEFMHLLALKEAFAIENDLSEPAEICRDAQGKFLRDHLGRWIGLFVERLSQTAVGGPYLALARFTLNFLQADAACLGIELSPQRLIEVRPTPLGPELSCEACPL